MTPTGCRSCPPPPPSAPPQASCAAAPHGHAPHRPTPRRAALAMALLAAALGGGCASAPEQAGTNPEDPWERWNRGVYSFNDVVDRAALKPLAQGYGRVVPEPVRTGVRNFFGNVGDVWSTLNLLLQGRVGDACQEGLRFSINTVFGVGGTVDVAGAMRLDSHRQDLGLTLGHWGVGSGPYLVLPVFGPSTLRDGVALPFDKMATSSRWYVEDMASRNIVSVLSIVSTRHTLLEVTDVLDDVAIDPYTFTRDAYLQRRRNLVEDGLTLQLPPQAPRFSTLVWPAGPAWKTSAALAPAAARTEGGAATLAPISPELQQALAGLGAEPASPDPAAGSALNPAPRTAAEEWAEVARREALETFAPPTQTATTKAR